MEKVANTNAQVKGKEFKSEEFKAKKAAAAKKFAENQKARKEALKKLAEELRDKKLVDKLSPEGQKFVNDTLNPAVRSGFGGTSFFNKVFGDNPKVGDTVTLLEYMKRTFAAKAKLDKAIKEWADKGIVVEFKEAANQLESSYKIVKMA